MWDEANIETFEMEYLQQRVDKNALSDLLRSLSGRRAGIRYMTKDGRYRTMNGSFAYDNISDTHATMYEANLRSYRTIILNNVKEVYADGKQFILV